jgi:hypothetical protein
MTPALQKTAVAWWRKKKDASGHEHAADGKFGSGGGAAAKPKPTAVSSFVAGKARPEIGDRHAKLDTAVADLRGELQVVEASGVTVYMVGGQEADPKTVQKAAE